MESRVRLAVCNQGLARRPEVGEGIVNATHDARRPRHSREGARGP